MLYAYFGGLGADKRAIYELVLEQRGLDYALTAHTSPHYTADLRPGLQALWGMVRGKVAAHSSRVLYRGPNERRALVIMLQAACAANLAELGQRYCFVLPSVPSRPGSLAIIVPPQLRHDGSLPVHAQLWQAGRPLESLPVERHFHAYGAARHACLEPGGEGRAGRATMDRR